MNKHLRYASYVMRHKYYVFIEAAKLGIPWLGFWHDLSKFTPGEWGPYANHFYGPKTHHGDGTHTPVRDKSGYYTPTDTGDKTFDLAWHLHQGSNRHHWQWWVEVDDEGSIVVFEMPKRYMLEMLADWRGASRAQGSKSTVAEWYYANKDKLILHIQTRTDIVYLIYKDEYKDVI